MNQMIKREENEKKGIKLSDFPRKLRQIALVYRENEKPITLAEACRQAGVQYDTAIKYIQRCKKKGKNFWELVNREAYEYLKDSVHAVDRAVTEMAIQGMIKHAELYYRRTGIIQESQIEANIAVHFTHIVCPPTTPNDVIDVSSEEKSKS
ncbi:MAG: hypothetical protein ACREOW_03315 [Thermodesulfobacteriota bacterium]